MATYVELQVTSHFSFLRGASSPEELFSAAALLGHSALGLTDWGGVPGIVRGWRGQKATGVRMIAGARVDLTDGRALLLYPTDRAAWSRLTRLLSVGKARGGKGCCILDWCDVVAHAEGLIAILVPDLPDDNTAAHLAELRETFDARGYLALSLRRRPDDVERLVQLDALARDAGMRSVATGDVLYHTPEARPLQDVMTATRLGRTVADCGVEDGTACGEAWCMTEYELGTWECQAVCGICGRPWIVDGAPATALPIAGSDWCSSDVQSSSRCTPPRPDVAEHWLAVALLEHASIASFARFMLEMLSLGAPPALLEDIIEATNDELSHTQLTLSLARRFGAPPLEPGPLPPAAPPSTAIEDIARALVAEACVGETLSALELREASLHAADPQVRVTLCAIADDEMRHARLGWRSLQWLCHVGPPALTEVIRAEFERAMTEARRHRSGHPTDALEPYGILSMETKTRLFDEALGQLIAPCAEAILAAGDARRAGEHRHEPPVTLRS